MIEEAWMTFMPDGTDDDVWYTNPEGKLPEGYTYQKLNPNWSIQQKVAEQTADQMFDLMAYGVSFSKDGKRIDPSKVYAQPDLDAPLTLNGVPLYPKRTWVDLTDDEMLMIYGQDHEGKKYNLGRMVQQALKGKNSAST